jgi:tripartite-type tricarboxylate transporter receptor subunit TctC
MLAAAGCAVRGMRCLRSIGILTLTMIIGAMQPLAAQEAWPSKPVRVLVGFPAGTSSDIVARIYAQRLSEHFGRQFVIDNRVGFSSNLAADAVAKAAPDGHTVLLATVANTIGASIFRKLGFDIVADFAPVAIVASAPNILVVSPRLAVANVSEFIALARREAGHLDFGSAGSGTAPHLSGELFNMMTGSRLVHVPYKGNSQGLVDLAEGRLAAIFAPAPTVAGFLKEGRVKALATTGAQRSALVPDLPTIAESGLAGFDTSIWYGFLAPRGTPTPIVRSMATVLLQANERSDVRGALAASGAEPFTRGPEEAVRFVRDDVRKWAPVVEFARLSAD